MKPRSEMSAMTIYLQKQPVGLHLGYVCTDWWSDRVYLQLQQHSLTIALLILLYINFNIAMFI